MMLVPSAATSRIAPFVQVVAPRLYWRHRYGTLARLGESRPDIRLIRALCHPSRVSLDIGADLGESAVAMLGSSRSVVAFEPRPAQAGRLAAIFDAADAAARVESVALSDRSGTTTMRVPESPPGRSTTRDPDVLSGGAGRVVSLIEVPVRRLDDLRLDDIGFIKIDVAGHELAVLRGAESTLRSDHPTLLIEPGEHYDRHAIADFLAGLGYTGYFSIDGTLQSVDEFDTHRRQDPANAGDLATCGAHIFLPTSRYPTISRGDGHN